MVTFIEKTVFLALLFYGHFVFAQQDENLEKGTTLYNEESYREALPYLQNADRSGSIDAAYMLGMMYQNGWSVKRDMATAFDLFSQAAEKGNSFAQYELGMMYYRGKGVAKDHQKAFFWIRESAEQGYFPSKYSLAGMYYRGDGCTKNDSLAIRYAFHPAELGDQPSMHIMACAYYRRTDGEELQNKGHAFVYFLDSAEKIPMSQYYLGRMYERGEFVKPDNDIALEWYNKAAANGIPAAQKSFERLKMAITQKGSKETGKPVDKASVSQPCDLPADIPEDAYFKTWPPGEYPCEIPLETYNADYWEIRSIQCVGRENGNRFRFKIKGIGLTNHKEIKKYYLHFKLSGLESSPYENNYFFPQTDQGEFFEFEIVIPFKGDDWSKFEYFFIY